MVLKNLTEAVIKGDTARALELTREALENGIAPQDIINGGMISAMDTVGQRFQKQELFLPELLLAGKAMLTGMDILKPALVGAQKNGSAIVVVGTVKGDLHSIGKNLVVMMLEGAGCEVHDLGVNVSPNKFVAALRDTGASILGLSALLSTTVPMIDETIKTVKAVGLCQVKTIIGGAPVTQQYADRIGADGYAKNAAEAVDVVKSLIGVKVA